MSRSRNNVFACEAAAGAASPASSPLIHWAAAWVAQGLVWNLLDQKPLDSGGSSPLSPAGCGLKHSSSAVAQASGLHSSQAREGVTHTLLPSLT